MTIAAGRVSWFKLDKKFGFIELENAAGDAFLHIFVLKAAGYVSIPAGTTMRVRIEEEQGRRRVTEILDIDTSTGKLGQQPPVLRDRMTRS